MQNKSPFIFISEMKPAFEAKPQSSANRATTGGVALLQCDTHQSDDHIVGEGAHVKGQQFLVGVKGHA